MTRLARSLGVRPGEGRLVALVAAVFGTVEVARGFGEIASDTLVIGRLGAGSLPWLFIGLGLASLIAALAYGAMLGRLPRGRLSVGVLVLLAVVIVAMQAALVGGLPVVPLLWLTVYAAGAIAVTLTWTLAGTVLDARQAKRVFPICTSAAIAGSFIGSLGAGPAAALIGTEWVVGLEAAGLLLAAALVGRLGAVTSHPRLRSKPPRRPLLAEVGAGFATVVRSPLMRLVAVAYLLFSVLMFAVTAPFFRVMGEAFPAGASAELATVLGLLSAAVTATSFVVSLVVAPRVYARWGVGTAAVILPLVYLAGFGLWVVALTPVTAALVRYAQQVTQRGVSNAAWSAFHNVVPASRRAQVLAFNDGVPGQLGIALSGVLLLTADALLAPEHVPWLGAITALVCTFVVLAIRRRYAASLLRALREGVGEQVLEGGPGLTALSGDAQAIGTLVGSLDAPEPSVRRMAVELLGRFAARDAAVQLAGRVLDPDPGVRAAALEALQAVDPATAAMTLDRALADPDPPVRAAALRAAARLGHDAPGPLADALARDADGEVRAGLAVFVAAQGEHSRASELIDGLLSARASEDRVHGLRAIGALDRRNGTAIPGARHDAALLRALDDDVVAVRREAAAVISGRAGAPPEAVLERLVRGTSREQEAALWALDGHAEEAGDELRAWAIGQVEEAERIRAARRALGPADGAGGSLGFLAAVLEQRDADIVGRLLSGLAVLGAPEAAGLIRRCLASGDPDTRSQAIEALDSLGDTRLRRSVVALLDPASGETAAAPDTALRRLTDDPDPWIRLLALRARAERAAAEWSTIRGRAEADPDAIVRDALDGLGQQQVSVPDTARTLGDIDRMLFLRRVPLFSGLRPEDLQRLALAAVERLYAGEEPVVREGEPGDELIVLVEGTVRVVHVDADGGERLLRRYEAGDHFGELAVLRERPRAATVIAERPGVRGLAISGEALTAILRERPEAAMAMLATLAERIGTP